MGTPVASKKDIIDACDSTVSATVLPQALLLPHRHSTINAASFPLQSAPFQGTEARRSCLHDS